MKAAAIIVVLSVALLWLASTPAQAAPMRAGLDLDAADPADTVPVEGEQQTTTMAEAAAVAVDPTTWGLFEAPASGDEGANLAAFLDMIAMAEGTGGAEGYRMMFGGRLCASLADHPRQYFDFRNSRGEALRTSAAGRYQFLASTWDELKGRLGLQDFGPESQDAAAVELIRQRGALRDVKAGRLSAAVAKCAPVWASLPGAGYAQPERKFSQLAAAFESAGGVITEA